MSALLLSLVSGAVVAATPVTAEPWFEFRDYPMKSFERKFEGVTRFDLLIDPQGRVAGCTVTGPSGDPQIDKATCFLSMKRAKFRPARNSEGQPVWGTYRTQAVWTLPEDHIDVPAAPDLEVSVNQLPAGTEQPAAVKLAYAVDQHGTPTPGTCTMLPSSLRQPQALVQLACTELLQHGPHSAVLAPSGQPVPAVKTGAVLFKAGG